MVKLRAGVIGVGHLGQHHARLYASLPDSTLVGVTDQHHGRASVIAEKYGAQVFDALPDLLRQVDVVSIAVPTSGHYPLAKACLEVGKHVLVEKPLAVLPSEAEELLELAERNGCTLQVGHSERFNPIMQMMRPLIRRPVLFECHRLGTYSERGTDVDVVLDLMIHDLDLVLSCNPGPIEDVRAAGISVLSSTCDVANARIQFGNGCIANLTASRTSPKAMRQWRVFQPDSSLSIDFQSRRGAIGRRSTEPGRKPIMTVEEIHAGDDEPLKLQLESFLRAIREKSRPVVSGEDGAAALKLAHHVLSAISADVRRNA
ncbi:MAG: Gfo/Idh/MocA family oxidoreductase [Nitrospira sp. BO4]|jgi:predicted dehydrogenase|nr:Gfo/Idh/MocA family oxidoreductase [Nitrospira sp. BO4]